MKILKLFKSLIIGIYVVSGVLLAVFLIPKTGWKALSVATSSMSPVIPQGSLVIIHQVPPRSLKVGDVVTYINPANTKQTITHRIVATGTELGLPAFTTKGDANNAVDRQILGGNVVGKVVWHVPKLGTLTSWLRKPLGFALIIILPAILIIIDEIRLLVRRLKEADEPPEPPASAPPRPPKLQPKPTPSRRLDGLSRLALGVLVVLAFSGRTLAQITAQATLTGNTIQSASPANHLVISLVRIGAGNCSTTVNVSGNSNSHVSTNSSCSSDGNHNDVNVSNNSNQSGTGNRSNSSSTIITINDGNSGEVQIFNPTAAAVSLRGWTLADDGGHPRTLAQTIAAHATLKIPGQIGDGLTPAGDHLVLSSPSGAVDAVSWGNDTIELNPAVPAIVLGHAIERTNPNFDTNTAGDWQPVN